MNLLWSERSWASYLYWQNQDAEIVGKINALIKDAKRSPFSGLGKPEPLRNELKGFWSRRITLEHRLGSVEIWDSPSSGVVIQALDGPICFERSPVGEDGAALFGTDDRSRS